MKQEKVLLAVLWGKHPEILSAGSKASTSNPSVVSITFQNRAHEQQYIPQHSHGEANEASDYF